MNDTELMRLERKEVERERDIWAVVGLPPGGGVSMRGVDFSSAATQVVETMER